MISSQGGRCIALDAQMIFLKYAEVLEEYLAGMKFWMFGNLGSSKPQRYEIEK